MGISGNHPVPISMSPDSGRSNPSERLAEVRSKIAIAERRVRDLEYLLTEMILTGGTPAGDIPIPGGSTDDANIVRQELYAARAFEGELRTAEQFWNAIVQDNDKAEKDTQELAKRV